jgi:hypothetical protein
MKAPKEDEDDYEDDYDDDGNCNYNCDDYIYDDEYDFTKYGDPANYKKQHPVAYRAFGVLGAFLLIAPPALFCFACITLSRDVELVGPLVGLGMLGAILIGAGLVNIILAFVHQYSGHIFTMELMLPGILLVGLSFYILLS